MKGYLCRGCALCFRSMSAFDKHRVGKYEPDTRRCLTTSEMIAIGLELKKNGAWGVAEDEKARAYFGRLNS